MDWSYVIVWKHKQSFLRFSHNYAFSPYIYMSVCIRAFPMLRSLWQCCMHVLIFIVACKFLVDYHQLILWMAQTIKSGKEILILCCASWILIYQWGEPVFLTKEGSSIEEKTNYDGVVELFVKVTVLNIKVDAIRQKLKESHKSNWKLIISLQ